MKFVEKPPTDLPGRNGASDDLDILLRDYFQAEMPHPWPACPQPPARAVLAPLTPSSRWTLARSRFALAASIGMLLACLWGLGGKFVSDPPDEASTPLGITGQREKPYDPSGKPVDPSKVRIKESLIQDRNEGTKFLIEVFDK
jgi:hypothetical protein